MEYEHKGIKIVLSQFGDFTATIGGKFTRTSSLLAMKKRIDKSEEEKQQAFSALAVVRGYDSIDVKKISVIGAKHNGSKRSWSSHLQWVADDGSRYDHCYIDSAENMAAIRSAINLDARHRDETEALERAHEEASNAAWAKTIKHEMPST